MAADNKPIQKNIGFSYEGQRVVVEDIKKLEALSTKPALPSKEDINHYIEPVNIEYYLLKESRFVNKILYLYIPLIDPLPRDQDVLLQKYISENRFFDLAKIIKEGKIQTNEPSNVDANSIQKITHSYQTYEHLYIELSQTMEEAQTKENIPLYRRAFYFCEALTEYEPSLTSLEIFGDFISWNLNYLVRILNSHQISFCASDHTVAYFIKKRNTKWEQESIAYDESFTILSALFHEQAFPNRNLEEFNAEYFF